MKSTLRSLLITGILVALPTAVCAATAHENWDAQCKKCHAADGSGSGPMGKKLKLKDYTSAAVQAAMTDEEIAAAIKDGVKAEATSKLKMPAYAAKFSAEEIVALKDFVRGMAPKP